MEAAAPPKGNGAVPPQNVEAEASVLGSILMSEQVLDRITLEVRLRAEDFYRPRHALIYGSMLRLKEKAQPEAIDVVTVCDDLKRAGELEQAGGEAYVHSLPSMVEALGNHAHYARIVKDHSLLRSVLATSRDIQERVMAFKGEPRELIEQAEQELFRIGHEGASSELRSISDVLEEEIDKLERLSREGLDVTGTPAGFTELDNLTGGFQKGNLIVLAARPSMGKCVGGSTLVYDPTTGGRRRIDEVVAAVEKGYERWVASVGPDLKLRPAKVTGAMRSGVQQTYRLTTRLGRRLDATANHPLLTIKGWRELQDLSAGDRVAVPRTLPRPTPRASIPDHDIVLLAALIADGSLSGRTPSYCFGPRSPVKGEVEGAAAAMGLRFSARSSGHGTVGISAGRGSGPNPLTQMLECYGLMGKLSAEKFIPDEIFALDELKIGRFLSVLYACDGHIHVSNRICQIGYTTISERLAFDVQHLLLRLGIVSKIRRLRRAVYEGTGTVAREVRITDQGSVALFCERVGAFGKEAAVAKALSRLATVRAGTNVDTVPAPVWEHILEVLGGRPLRQLSVGTGRSKNHNWHVGTRGLSRIRVGEIAEWTRDPQLTALANSDVWWDEIESIESLGREETFDLTIDGTHNFVANDIVVHNSCLVTNICENAAVKYEKPVALFSLEMSEAELAQRFIASQARIRSDEMRKGRVKQDRWPKVIRATEKLARAPLYVDDSSDIGILEIRAKARRLHAREQKNGGLGLLVVDYLQLMRPEDSTINRVEQIGRISRGLKILARELEIPVIAVSQLSRAVEARPDKQPLLSDLRESGNIEQDADLVMFIYRDEYYNDDSERQGEADISIAKHRNGPLGRVTLTFISQYPKFANMAREATVEMSAEQGAGA